MSYKYSDIYVNWFITNFCQYEFWKCYIINCYIQVFYYDRGYIMFNFSFFFCAPYVHAFPKFSVNIFLIYYKNVYCWIYFFVIHGRGASSNLLFEFAYRRYFPRLVIKKY